MKTPPELAAAAVKRLSPLNPYGDPKLRLIHGSDALCYVEGWWEDCSPEGIFLRKVFERRLVHKYLANVDCWILEWWEPPEFWGTPEQWAATTRQWEGGRGFNECGPYPDAGDYRFLVAFRHRTTGLPTVPTEAVIQRIYSLLAVPKQSDLDALRDFKDEEARKRRRENIENVFGDMPFEGRTDSISLNSKGLLAKLAEKNKQVKEKQTCSI